MMRALLLRCLTILLGIGLLLGFPASCGKKNNVAQDNSGKSNVSSKDNSVDDEELVMEVKGGDLKGYNLRIASWFGLEPTPRAEYYEIYLKRKKALEKKFNCTISYIQIPANKLYETVEVTAASAEPVADIIRLRSHWVVPVMAGKGLLLPVDQYFDLNDPMWNKVCTRESMYKGRPYGVNSSPTTSWACVWYNRTLLKKARLKDPVEMISSRTWTWDKWVEYSNIISKLSTDQKIVYGTNIPHPIAFIASNGGRVVRSVNNKDIWSLDSFESIEALKYLKKVIDMNIAGGDAEDFAEGRLGFFFTFNWVNDFRGQMTDKWGLLPYPIGPNASDYTAYNEELHLMCLPKGAQHPSETARIWTVLSKPYPGIDAARSAYSKFLNNERDIQTALMLQTKFTLDRYWGYEEIRDNIIYASNGNSLSDALLGNTGRPLEEWVNDVTPIARSYIEKLWSQFK